MPRTEIAARRGPRSKTFDNGDGTRTCVIGGGIAHHQEGGVWVETDCTLDSDGTEYVPRRHPHGIRIPVNYAQPLRVGDVAVRPLDFARPPSRVEPGQRSVLYVQAYDGIDVERIVVPEGVVELLHVTSERGRRPLSWDVKGDAGFAPTWYREDDPMAGGVVPVTRDGSTVTYDLSVVPVGGVVR